METIAHAESVAYLRKDTAWKNGFYPLLTEVGKDFIEGAEREPLHCVLA